ncbi:hypothetical protein [Spongorhabdus nitratireducens]
MIQSEELNKVTMRDISFNKKTLSSVKLKLEDFLSDKETSDYLTNLYSSEIDEDWLYAQCKSACNQIDKVIDENSQFNSYYSNILTESDLILLTQELICDTSILDQISGNMLKLNNKISRSNYLASHQFFLHAKFSYFTKKFIAETTTRNFNFSSMPTLIRQAIEIRVKNMIGLEKVEKVGGGFKFIPISKLLDFFGENDKYLEIPVSIEVLKNINTWTNTFVHTGVVPFCWQSLEAVDLIEDFFPTKDEKTGSLDLHGFTYLSKDVDLEDIKNDLDKYFNATFTLNKESVEGTLVRS